MSRRRLNPPSWLRRTNDFLEQPLMAPHSDSNMASRGGNAAMLGMKTLSGLALTGLASDSRKVKPGYLFAALAGTKTDGARFVEDAVARGAVAVMGPPSLASDVEALGVRFI